MSQDTFRHFITQISNKFNVRTTPLFLNGLLEDTQVITSNICLYQVMPSNPTAKDINSLEMNASIPSIHKIVAISNSPIIEKATHPKIQYVETNKFYGLQFSDITNLFQPESINIFLYDSAVIDINAITYLKYLTVGNIGLLSSKIIKNIPDSIYKYNVYSEQNKNSSFEFNGFVINGKLEYGNDLYVSMYGSLNILVRLLVNAGLSVVNISNIVSSYLFEKNPDITILNNYIIDNFPIIYALPQLYFNDNVFIVVPEIEEIQTFIRDYNECVDYERPKNIPIETELILLEDKNKIVSKFYYEYKQHYKSKIDSVESVLNEQQKSKLDSLEKEIQKLREDKLTAINSELDNYNKVKTAEFEQKYHTEVQKIEASLSEMTIKNQVFLETTKYEKLNQIEIECISYRNSKLQTINEIIKNDENDAHKQFKEQLQTYVSQSYQKLEYEIQQSRAQRFHELESEVDNRRSQLFHVANEDHQREKARLTEMLISYENFKKNELERKNEIIVFESYSKLLSEMQMKLLDDENEKKIEIDKKLFTYKSEKIKKIDDFEKASMARITQSLEEYENENKDKLNKTLEEYKKIRKTDFEFQLESELNLLKTERIKTWEEFKIEELTEYYENKRNTYMEGIDSEMKLYKHEKLEKLKLELETENTRFLNKKIEENEAVLCQQTIDRESKIQSELKVVYENKSKELDKVLDIKKQQCERDISKFKIDLLDEARTYIHEFRTSEVDNIELFKKSQISAIQLDNKKHEAKLKELRELYHEEQINIINRELVKEKEQINYNLSVDFSVELEKTNAIRSQIAKSKYESDLEQFKLDHEQNISQLNRKYDSYSLELQDKYRNEKVSLEKQMIEDHNVALNKLEEMYNNKNIQYKIILKESLEAERAQILESEKEKIKDQLDEQRITIFRQIEADKITRLEEGKKAVEKEIQELKKIELYNLSQDLIRIKKGKQTEIDLELVQYKKANTDTLNKEFKSLLNGLSSLK
jgi:hypothetical protein